jgi:hypothetical protein
MYDLSLACVFIVFKPCWMHSLHLYEFLRPERRFLTCSFVRYRKFGLRFSTLFLSVWVCFRQYVLSTVVVTGVSYRCWLFVILYSPTHRFFLRQYNVMKTTAFWDITPCVFLEVNWRFRGVYCLHPQDHPDDWGSKNFCNVSLLLRDYTAQYPRRLSYSDSPPWEPEVSQGRVVFAPYISQQMEELIL